ncbi:hypothetical protein KCU78_g16218, partial [Aureobasidium melanogenum]
MNTPPVPWGVDAAPLYEAVRRVATEAQAATQETPIKSQCTATTNQIQSTTGVETIKVKNPFDSSQRNENHTCTDIEVPHTHSIVPTAHMNSSGPALESDMESVDISSDDKSDDGWSFISNGSDFVVVDSAETTYHSANAKSRRKSKLPKRISKLQARLRALNTGQQNMMACQNEQGEPDRKTEVNRSGQEDDENKQRLAGPKDNRNVIDELIERLTEQARALKL